MDKIRIIREDIEDDEDDESEEDMDEDNYEDYKELIKEKTDRELMESIALRLMFLEKNVKQIQDDLVDTYNLIIESGVDEEED